MKYGLYILGMIGAAVGIIENAVSGNMNACVAWSFAFLWCGMCGVIVWLSEKDTK